MNTFFVTGASGFIGEQLIKKLVDENKKVKVLCRATYPNWFAEHSNIQIIKGDLFSKDLAHEFIGVDGIFHLAAYAKPWAKDESIYHKINVKGTQQIIELAEKARVKKVVVTSSAGALGPQVGENLVTESQINTKPKTAYEVSKIEVLALVKNWKGKTKVCAVSPSRVFGTGKLSTSNAVTKMMVAYAKGTWRFIPGSGNSIGNYAFVEDVVTGHLLAMQKGQPNQNYILGGENLTFNQFFYEIGKATNSKKKMFHLPMAAMLAFGKLNELYTKAFNLPPIITTPWIKKYNENWGASSQKAQKELGYAITLFQEAVKKTISKFGYL